MIAVRRPSTTRTVTLGVVGRVAAAGAVTGACWAIGLDLASSLSIALFVLVVFALRGLPAGAVDSWQPEPESARNAGTRREVARLSWGLHGLDARVDRWSAGRLRTLAARRLADRGLDLDDPADEAGCRQVLGSQAYAALSVDPNNLPRYSTFVAALDVVERLTPELPR
jgi:hypothetical protein